MKNQGLFIQTPQFLTCFQGFIALQVENEEILRIALDSIQNIYQDNPCGGIDEFQQQFVSMSEVIRI